MAALEWFKEIPELQKRVHRLSEEVESAHAAAGPHGQQMGSIGGSGKSDSLAGVDRLMDSGTERELSQAKRTLTYRMTYALWVLYGRDGRGGLAKERGSADADLLCCRYLQGMRWSAIASEIVKPDTEYPVQWCRQRARAACRHIDRLGMQTLVDW